jgi:hypothetical protein
MKITVIFIYLVRLCPSLLISLWSGKTELHGKTYLIRIYCIFTKMVVFLPGLAYFSECLVRVRDDTKRGFNAYSMRNHEKCTPLNSQKSVISLAVFLTLSFLSLPASHLCHQDLGWLCITVKSDIYQQLIMTLRLGSIFSHGLKEGSCGLFPHY